MDMSVVEGEEKPVDVNEVPEYATEIHEYLRELEVRDSTATHKPLANSLTKKISRGGLMLPCFFFPHSR